MKLDKSAAIFIATRVDSKLREGLMLSKVGDKKYFDGTSADFLRVIEVDEEKWVGKAFKGGTAVTEIEDIQRNLLSILRRVAPNVRIPASAVKIFVVSAAIVAADPRTPDEASEDPGDEVGDGPYITY